MEYSRTPPIEFLAAYYKRYASDAVFRQRVILSKKSPRGDSIACCVIQKLDTIAPCLASPTRIDYADAVLYEDWLTGDQCLQLAQTLAEGSVEVATDIYINPEQHTSWRQERLSSSNQYMEETGWVVTLPIHNGQGASTQQPMLTVGAPYYPDVYEATKHWSGLRQHFLDSDDRNSAILFLLPENRAYLSGGTLNEDNSLVVTAQGTSIPGREMQLQGAVWSDGHIRHLSCESTMGHFKFDLPHGADRLELYLMDAEGEVYDVHKESNTWAHGRKFLQHSVTAANTALMKAIETGEGTQIEFKAWVSLGKNIKENGDMNKLGEIVKTVASFSNTEGGQIFIGIDDNCQIVGIDDELPKWAKRAFSDESLQTYIGALRSAINDHILGEASFNISPISSTSGHVIVINVNRASTLPISIKSDDILWVRRGASNQKVAPVDWRKTITASRNG